MFAAVLLVGLAAPMIVPPTAQDDDPFADLAPAVPTQPVVPEKEVEIPPPGRGGPYAMRFADDDARVATVTSRAPGIRSGCGAIPEGACTPRR